MLVSNWVDNCTILEIENLCQVSVLFLWLLRMQSGSESRKWHSLYIVLNRYTHPNKTCDSHQTLSPSQWGLHYSQPVELLRGIGICCVSVQTYWGFLQSTVCIRCSQSFPPVLYTSETSLPCQQLFQGPKVSGYNFIISCFERTHCNKQVLWTQQWLKFTFKVYIINSSSIDTHLKNNVVICERYTIQFPKLVFACIHRPFK